jgi:lipopolysaccharide/colanic/teichoic acid biosynthesis glycosyltransferase
MRLFRALVPYGVGPLFLSEMFLIAACFAAASWTIDPLQNGLYLMEDGAAPVIIAVATIMLAMYMTNLYSSVRVRNRLELLQDLSQAVGLALIAQSVVGYIRSDLILPKWFMIGGCLLTLLLLFGWRLLYSKLVEQVAGSEKLLFVGESEASLDLARHLSDHPDCGYAVAGFVTDTPQQGTPWLGTLDQLRDIVAKVRPGRIIVGMAERRNQFPVSDLFYLRFVGVSIQEARLAVESICARVCTRDLLPARVIFHRELEPSAGNRGVSIVLTKVFAAIVLLVFSPLILIAAIAIAIRHRGAPIESSLRVGCKGKTFRQYRFRARLPFFRMLPALWNVVRGQMAMVGPRPERPEYVRVLAQRLPFYEYRHGVRPGLVGWSQMHEKTEGRLLDSMSKLEYDLYFIKHATLSMQLLILLSSFKNSFSNSVR